LFVVVTYMNIYLITAWFV